jgi:hypothetical protein
MKIIRKLHSIALAARPILLRGFALGAYAVPSTLVHLQKRRDPGSTPRGEMGRK